MNAMSRLTPEQRAAVVLVSLDPDHAQPLAEQLGLSAMRRIHDALSSLEHVPQEDMLAAFAEFITQLDSFKDGIRGGKDESLSLLRKALGEPLVEKLAAPETNSAPTVWTRLAEMETPAIAEFIGRQHGAVAALMLHKLPGELVPEILGLMPKSSAVEAIGLLSRAEDPSEAAVKVAERIVEQDMLGSNGGDPTKDPKIIMLGETLGTLPSDLRDAALTRLEEEDETRAAAVRATLLRIEDIPERLPGKSVQVIFREVEKETLIKGLASVGAKNPEVSEFLLGNIAQRMADQYREQIAELPEMADALQDKAIGGLVREILSLSRRGDITLLPSQSDE